MYCTTYLDMDYSIIICRVSSLEDGAKLIRIKTTFIYWTRLTEIYLDKIFNLLWADEMVMVILFS